ncbi:TipJ family phage tail tip protein [Volucribacter amazonae]|uniref:Phage tail protein n=1 Tax=Volucribacter amazonae TaxID=256731 RepID=A0A9X4SHI2_9PAST|nr:phage tail protein [Volucribacter amazonae]MDG6894510.1 hypothetical protein [Volucribacter amazonae]
MGGSQGGGGRTPVEAKESGRSKQKVKIVEIISEGEIQGLVDGVKSVFLDNTPIQASDDSYNFENVVAEGRIGSQDQDILTGFDTSEKEVSVGTQVRKTTPITRTITDNKVTRLRLTLGVQSLFAQNDQGDTNPTHVDLKISIGDKSYSVSIHGKYSSQYLRQFVYQDLPPVPFRVKVERITADSQSQRLQNNTLWASYTEIIDTEFTYPNTAVVGMNFDSEYFSSIPNRTYEVLGIKVKVPSNYDPITRQYQGMWDGTFKIAWTNNPAWVLYDIVTNKRYGLGQRLGDFGVDKWALYQVAQYCDQLVPDGFGGQEPRFTCNAWITEQRSAYEVINDICSIFRAMPVWNGRELTVIMDRPADPVWTYTNANVLNGEFSYQYSAMKARHNALQVEYADATNNYEKTIEYVSDDESIRRYGLNLKKITAFGCTSRGQAHRTGLWILQTEKLETKTVTFSVGAEGLMHIPGDIIQVADSHFAGTDIGGRVVAVNGRMVTLDREIDPQGESYFNYINSSAKSVNIKILAVAGKQITLDSPPTGLQEQGIWTLTSQQVSSQLFRALTISEEEKGKYRITALQHEPQKEAIVDNGAFFEPKKTTLLTAPQLQQLYIGTAENGAIAVTATTSSGLGSVKYDVRIYKDGSLYDVKLGLNTPNLTLEDLPNGEYRLVIAAKNEDGQLINEKIESFTVDKPPMPTGVRVTGGLSDISLEWDYIDEFTQTEIFASAKNQLSSAVKIAKVFAKSYSHNVGAKQIRYYWLRHTRGINTGAFYQQQGLKGESGVDIEQELAFLNEKLSGNIVNDIIDTALPARNLELIKYVDELDVNTNIGHNQVSYNGQLYTWNKEENKYKALDVDTIDASKINGKIGLSQIETITFNNITGEIPTTKLPKISLQGLSTDLVNSLNEMDTYISETFPNDLNSVKNSVQQVSNSLTTTARSIGTKITNLETANKNTAESIKTLTAQSKTNKQNIAGLQQSVSAIANDTSTQAQSINSLNTELAGVKGNVTALQNSISENNKAITEKYNGLSTTVNNVTSNIQNLQKTVSDNNSTQAKSIENLSSRLDNIKIGGRNLILGSEVIFDKYTGRDLAKLEVSPYIVEYMNNTPLDLTVSIYIEYSNFKGSTTYLSSNRIGLCVGIRYTDNTTQWVEVFSNGETNVLPTSIKGRISKSYKVAGNKTIRTIDVYVQNRLANFDAIVGYPQLEIGNITTEWTKAPEDTDTKLLDAVSADIKTLKETQTTQNTAITQQLSTATSKITNLESRQSAQSATVSNLQKTVSDTSGKVQSIYGVKIQTVSNGKKVLAGITLNANEIASEIVLATNKLLLIDPTSGNNTAPFEVKAISGSAKIFLKGDLIASGTVTADKIASNAITSSKIATNSINASHIVANSITSAQIQAGAIRAEHLAADAISAEKLAVGLGGNIIPNPIFANDGYGWKESKGTYTGTVTRTFRSEGDNNWTVKDALPTEKVSMTRFNGTVNTTGRYDPMAIVMRVSRGKTYIFSGYFQCLRCEGMLLVEEYANETTYTKLLAQSNPLVRSNGNTDSNVGGSFINGFATAPRYFLKFTAPNSGWVRLAFRVVSWNGTNPDVYIGRPQLEEVPTGVNAPTQWKNSGVTSIHGGSIVANSITTEQLSANAVTANNIAAGAINSNHIATNSINANHIVSKSLTADLLNVSSLSAISANLGAVTAGRITGTTIEGNQIVGGSISGTTLTGSTVKGGIIEGNTINGGVINGATGNFAGTIYAQNIIGDVVKMYVCNKNQVITIGAMPFTRILILIPIMISTKYTSVQSGSNPNVTRRTYHKVFIDNVDNNKAIISDEVIAYSGGEREYKMVSGYYTIPADTELKLKYRTYNNGSSPNTVTFLVSKV